MREYWETINCPNRVYQLYAYEIDPTSEDGEDKEFVEMTRDGEAHELAKRMNPRDTAGRIRSWEERLKDAYLGVLAENLIRKYLRTEFGQVANVISEPYATYDEHVDIEINWNGGDETSIEVRSSFAYGDMSKVVCNIFDHLGPYTTVYKSYEPPKDYYLRGVLHEGERKNSFRYDRKHILYFAGGVPHHWFKEMGEIKRGREMKPIDFETAEKLLESGEETLYKTVPIWQGMDPIEIINEIREAVSAV